MVLAEEEATHSLPRDARLGDSSGKMKQFATWFTHGVVGGAKLRGAIYHRRTGAEVLGVVDEFFRIRPAGDGDSGPDPGDDEPQSFPDCALVCD